MDDIKRIIFKLVDESKVEIHAVIEEKPLIGDSPKTILIGDIFSKGSFSGKESIQICGFDDFKGAWSCGRYNHSMDCCLIWNGIKQFLKSKTGKVSE